MSDQNETYLGDGLYVSVDGWSLTLRAPRLGGDHYVVLEPEVMVALLKYIATVDGVGFGAVTLKTIAEDALGIKAGA